MIQIMNTSFLLDLKKAMLELEPIIKDATARDRVKSWKYASSSEIIKKVSKALLNNNIILSVPFKYSTLNNLKILEIKVKMYHAITGFTHTEVFTNSFNNKEEVIQQDGSKQYQVKKNMNHVEGGLVTYWKRYAITSMLFLDFEDDDIIENQEATQDQKTYTNNSNTTQTGFEPMTDKQKSGLYALTSKLHDNHKKTKYYEDFKAKFNTLSKKEASAYFAKFKEMVDQAERMG